jgi:hypothetical protein
MVKSPVKFTIPVSSKKIPLRKNQNALQNSKNSKNIREKFEIQNQFEYVNLDKGEIVKQSLDHEIIDLQTAFESRKNLLAQKRAERKGKKIEENFNSELKENSRALQNRAVGRRREGQYRSYKR